jgi:predicted metal-dependent enzyme (double-stranded beta helix superfamily)
LAHARMVCCPAPLIGELTKVADVFPEPVHRRRDQNRYARDLIFTAEDDTLSLLSLVWAPG